jgi:hypothetical protein
LVLENGIRIPLLKIATEHGVRIFDVFDYKRAVEFHRNYENGPDANEFPKYLDEMQSYFESTVWLVVLKKRVNFAAFRSKMSQAGFVLNYSNPELSLYKEVQSVLDDMVCLRFVYEEGSEEDKSEYLNWRRRGQEKLMDTSAEFASGLLDFFADRLKVQLREQGARHDLVDAVFALEGQDDLVLIVRRVEALGKFLDTDDGRNLLAGYKRATNIIRIEEKKDAPEYVGAPDLQFYRQDEERSLARAIDAAKAEASAAVAKEDFEAAMRAMATLRPHVDAFFDKVTVNVADGPEKNELRANRLKLLNEIREATRAVADFSRIEGG